MKILTSNGFKNFDGFVTNPASKLITICLSDGRQIDCTPEHLVLVGEDFIPACFVENGDVIDERIVVNVFEYDADEKVYDALNVEDGNHYLTNGITSHNCVYLDEFAFVENAETFYTSTYPVITSGKDVRIIISSTPNGVGNLFHKIWLRAQQRIPNSFVPFRVRWWDVPGRDEQWKKDTIANTSQRQFDQEFGVEFLGSSNTLIDADVLTNIVACDPIELQRDVKYYEAPEPDHTYVMTVDVSKGRGQDYSTFTVFDTSAFPYKQVATFRDNLISPLLFPDLIVRVARAYNDAIVVVENNDVGVVVANAIYYEYEYENMFVESTVHAKGVGVTMTKLVKRIGCSNLKDLIELKKLLLCDADTIQELSSFEANGSSYEAADGTHDDMVMNLVLFAWFVSSDGFGYTTFSSLKDELYSDRLRELDEDVVPVGILGSGRSAGGGVPAAVQEQIDALREWNAL